MHPVHRLLMPLAAFALVSCGESQLPVAPSDRNATLDLASAGAPLNVEVQFGIDSHGSPFPPPEGHDASGHARDKVYPREVVLARGGSVTFFMTAVHQVAVYEPGTEPGDIEISASTLEDVDLGPFVLPDFRINDPENRIVLGPAQTLFDQEWTTPAGTFDEPGRYLVICTTVPHFVSSRMWAWVTVK